ncbi:MAG: winged helix-turn-helix transcriptional regulator [Candidatus Heimdallarchaeota archaeon]|nr:MAG: winged helix-turn-helix transcriptional regulator [Candidatus Heimdallarchaeota archaeon]
MDIKSAKTQKNKLDGLAFVLRGKNRRQIYYSLLNENLTQSEISIITGISPTNVSRVIKQFKKLRIARNYTPEERIGGIYGLTPFGTSFKTEFLKHLAFRAIKETRYSNL